MSYSPNRSNIPRQAAAAAAAIPLTQILGIAIGGAVAFFAILAVLGVYFLRRHDQLLRARQNVEIQSVETNELAGTIRSETPRQMRMSDRSTFVPFLPTYQSAGEIRLIDDEIQVAPPLAQTNIKKLSPQKAFSKFTHGFRESWPLHSSLPNALLPLGRLQSQSTVTLNHVAPPGYQLPPEPRWPRRAHSRNTKTRVMVSNEGTNSDYFTTGPYQTSPPRPLQRRATSENQLSTILRSTSQRLKSTHRRSLSRTLTTLCRLPGSPPKGRLPPTPTKIKSESREVLIDRVSTLSVNSAFYESYITRTPSPGKKAAGMADKVYSKRDKSPSPSAGSDDSLCGMNTPDLVIPAPLTSPSKHGTRAEQRHTMRISSNGPKDMSSIINRGSKASVLALGRQDSVANNLSLTSPHRISLASDPFYSSVKSAKPVIPVTKIYGPRPLYIRKATFGQEETSERPPSMTSPLKEISGNKQSPSMTDPEPSATVNEPNPFQWSPQLAMQSRLTSPTRSESPRRKGHKRSKVVRMSNLPRPPSVSVVPEEPEEEISPLRLQVPHPPVRLVEPSKSPSPGPDFVLRRLSARPPSIMIFNPCVSVPKLIASQTSDSPTLGLEIYSPTLATTNYYTSPEKPSSEDEFFRPKRSANLTRNRRESSISSVICPTTKLEEMISFPSPVKQTKGTESPSLSPNSEILKALADSRKVLTAPLFPPHLSLAVVAQPIVTNPIPIPGHLTGPRDPPRRYSCQKNPKRESLHTSICLLRRMNSEISTQDSVSSLYSNSSPLHPEPTIEPSTTSLAEVIRRSASPSPSPKTKIRDRSSISKTSGSKHYLSLISPPHQRHRVEKRDSTRIIRDRRQRKLDQSLQKVESESEEEGLTPVQEFSESHSQIQTKEVRSPASDANAIPLRIRLRFPTISISGKTGASPPASIPIHIPDLPPKSPLARSPVAKSPSTRTPNMATSPLIQSPISQTASYHNQSPQPLLIPVTNLEIPLPQPPTPTPKPDQGRWSSVMTPPSIKSVRHESQMEHPSPLTPPKWNWRRESKLSIVSTPPPAQVSPTRSPRGLRGNLKISSPILISSTRGSPKISLDISIVAGTAFEKENLVNERGNRSPDSAPPMVIPADVGMSGNRLSNGSIMVKEEAQTKKKRGWGNWNGNHGRPDSLGLYDAEGFLRSSPDREGALERERLKAGIREL